MRFTALPTTLRTLQAALVLSLLGATPASAQVLFGRLVPPPPALQSNGPSLDANVSDDGRVFAFSSSATNWVPGSITGSKVIVVDFGQRTVENLSLNLAGAALNGSSIGPAIGGSGRYVSFETLANNLGIASSGWQIVRKDRQTGQLFVASTNSSGQPASGSAAGQARSASISADGNLVAFRSDASNLITGSGGNAHIYVKNIQTGTLDLASPTSSGGFPTIGTSASTVRSISADGRLVVFQTGAPNIVAGVSGGGFQVYLRDRTAGINELISAGPGGVASNSQSDNAAISPNGRYVSFRSFASNLGSPLTTSRVFVRDRLTGTTFLVPVPQVNGNPANGCRESDVSDTGTIVYTCFFSGLFDQVFTHIPGVAGTPFIVSTSSGGSAGNELSGSSVAIDASGRSLSFDSRASNLVTDDTNAVADIFILGDASVLDGLFGDGFE